MKITQFYLWKETEYTCPTPGKFIPHITGYFHEDEKIRPALLVVPGGAYRMVAVAEGEVVAKRFFEKGFQVFVLTYTTAVFENTALKKMPLKDIAKAVRMIRFHAAQWKIDPRKITAAGFSAGGHLVSSLSVHYDDPELKGAGEFAEISARPDAVILSYPVITTGEYMHKGSMEALYGVDMNKEEADYADPCNHVNSQTPPAFIWTTVNDQEVPMENSLLYAKALKAEGIPFALHIFSDGEHGSSIADASWASGEYGGYYCMDQFFANMQYMIDNEIPMSNGMPLPPKGTDYRSMFENGPKDYLKKAEIPEIAVWPELAVEWLKKQEVFA